MQTCHFRCLSWRLADIKIVSISKMLENYQHFKKKSTLIGTLSQIFSIFYFDGSPKIILVRLVRLDQIGWFSQLGYFDQLSQFRLDGLGQLGQGCQVRLVRLVQLGRVNQIRLVGLGQLGQVRQVRLVRLVQLGQVSQDRLVLIGQFGYISQISLVRLVRLAGQLIRLVQLANRNQVGLVSVCAKFQLPSMSKSS